MNKNSAWAQYEARLGRVCDYIHNHLDDDLDMDILARVACLSRYHWHRIYRAIYGETITATIKRLRLKRAADELVFLEMPIAKIAHRAGYPNLQSFNRTFKKAYGLPPGKYREKGGTGSLAIKSDFEGSKMFDVRIEMQGAVKLAGLRHSGPYRSVGIAFEKLNGLAASRGLHGPNQRFIGIYYDDPHIVKEEELRSFAGLSISSSIAIEPPLETAVIAGGNHAIFRFHGPYSNMETCYKWIFEDWLKPSGYMLRDEPNFEEYLNPTRSPPSELLTDIYLPLA